MKYKKGGNLFSFSQVSTVSRPASWTKETRFRGISSSCVLLFIQHFIDREVGTFLIKKSSFLSIGIFPLKTPTSNSKTFWSAKWSDPAIDNFSIHWFELSNLSYTSIYLRPFCSFSLYEDMYTQLLFTDWSTFIQKQKSSLVKLGLILNTIPYILHV